MRFTQLFTKTKRQAPADETSVNAQLLTRGGFIHKNMAGVYSFLPLGLRVLKKIENIIREEMDGIGGQELHLNILQDKSLWEKTGRWSEAKNVMYRLAPTINNQQLTINKLDTGLGFTHEEVVAQIASQHIQSHKDLPKYVYQIQTKFRNEPRAQAGLLRGREFGMKDLYSLTATQEQTDEFYEKCAEAYIKIFKRLGIGAIRTLASGGLFSKRSDEFQVIADVGEDRIFVCPEKHISINKEIIGEEGKKCSQCGKEFVEQRSIEVGNIFKLGTRFSEPLGLFFTDKDGSRKPVVMGSYGIGTGRAMATIVEVHHDKKGIVWPESAAPFLVFLVNLKSQNTNLKSRADKFYQTMVQRDIEVLYDDREDASVGEKFADADLIGCPWRLVVSEKTGDKVEVKRRGEDKTELINAKELIKKVALPQNLFTERHGKFSV